jgi:hypothetical protein
MNRRAHCLTPPFNSSIRSDTDEIAWQARGVVTVDTPRTQALVGFLGDLSARTTHLSANVNNPFCTVMVTSLDSEPIETSRRLSLLTTSRCANSQMERENARKSVVAFGSGPTCIEPVTGTVTLCGLKANALHVQPLTAVGSLGIERNTAICEGDTCEIDLSKGGTTWYVVACKP